MATDMNLTLPSDQEATGRTLGAEEIHALSQAIHSGILTSTKGSFTKHFETSFAKTLGVKHAFACSSGTAAIHVAVAVINPNPGDEIITTGITDMGALTPILYQGAIPVFADVDPITLNVTAQTIQKCLSPRTRAIIVTHLFGQACDMTPILTLAQKHNIPVIEDCAQAFLSRDRNRLVGTMGTLSCFSLQQGKHITTGEGGIVCTNSDELAKRAYHFINKAWGYGEPNPDHRFLALNYRMSELQGAVASAQLEKLAEVVTARIRTAKQFSEMISDIPGIVIPKFSESSVHTFWKYCVHVDGRRLPGGTMELSALLKKRGINSAPRYIQKPAFQCEVIKNQVTFGNSHYPFTLARKEALDYSPTNFPGTFAALESVLVLPWNERYTEKHVAYISGATHQCVEEMKLKGSVPHTGFLQPKTT